MKNKTTYIILGAIILIATLGLGAFFIFLNPQSPPQSQSGKIKIIATLFPYYDFAKNIAKDKADISMLLPPGVEPHSFEPKPSDIAKIYNSNIFIYTGPAMEPWADDILSGASNRNLSIVNCSSGINLLSAVFHDNDEPEGAPDPHIWLDFDNDKTIALSIVNALKQKDPANADYYEQNYQDYLARLSALDAKYKSSLANCKTKKIVYGGHYAFGYLAKKYNLEYTAAQGLAPDSEPTASDIILLINQIRDNKLSYIFYEELTSPKIAQTIASETGAKMLLLNGAHNLAKDDFEKNVSFVDVMEKNLENIRIGLQCN